MAKDGTVRSNNEWLRFSLKSMTAILLGTIGLGLYIGVLIYGENSLSELEKILREKTELEQDRDRLKRTNQQLQKEYFELLQHNVD